MSLKQKASKNPTMERKRRSYREYEILRVRRAKLCPKNPIMVQAFISKIEPGPDGLLIPE